MLSLTQARKKAGDAGDPLFMPFKVLKDADLHLRKGQFTIIAAAPGGMKSALTQYILQTGDGEGNRNSVLYISADSDADTMLKRAGAIATGWEQWAVNQQMHGDEHQQRLIKKKIDEATDNFQWSFKTGIEDWELLDELEGFRTVYGEYPDCVVMDNVMDLRCEGVEGDIQMLEASAMFLSDLAKDTGSCIIGLHHVMGSYEGGGQPIDLSGLRGKISKKPEQVLTLHRTGNMLHISPVKNRNGLADSSGNTFYSIQVEPASMQFRDMPPPPSNYQGNGFTQTTLGTQQ